MYILYSVLLVAGFVLAAPVYLWRGRARGQYLETFRERMGRLPAALLAPRPAGGEPSIWIHAVSVGEVLAARPLVAALKERFPSRSVFLSTTTLTGRAVAGKSVRSADGLFFAPFDWPRPVRRALRALQPRLLVLVETEIWPNLIHEARRHGTRVAMVNGRISPSSHSGYRRIRPFLRRVLAEVDLFLMQGDAHAERMRDLGAPPERIKVTGNLKFDALGPAAAPAGLLELLGPPPGSSGRLIVAGSTMEGEEELILAAYRRVREEVPGARLLLAPRHPERFAMVAALVEKAGLGCRRRTTLAPGGLEREDVLVLDTLGELAHVYPLAEVVFVGGSLVPTGGHNILEAAVAGKPVVVGPHLHNFQEIADRFRAERALVEVRSGEELARELTSLLRDEGRRRELGERARAIVEKNRGALARTVDALAGLLA